MTTISKTLLVVEHRAYLVALKTPTEIGSLCFMLLGVDTAKKQNPPLPNSDKNSDKNLVTKKISWEWVSLIGIIKLIQHKE